MGEKIRTFTAKELERLLARYGFTPVPGKEVIKSGETIPPGGR